MKKLIVLLLLAAFPAWGTWKPEYGKEPQAVQDWFSTAAPPVVGAARLGISSCCEKSERFVTKFVGGPNDSWAYYTNPACVTVGCPLAPIPDDVIETNGIHSLNPKDDNLPQFQEMRRQGVLFIWQGKPTCFWPPEGGI